MYLECVMDVRIQIYTCTLRLVHSCEPHISIFGRYRQQFSAVTHPDSQWDVASVGNHEREVGVAWRARWQI